LRERFGYIDKTKHGYKMGNIHRIKRRLKQGLILADTQINFNNCRVLLGSANGSVATKVAGQFGEFMKHMVGRANRVNIGDLYEAHFKVLGRLEAKKPLFPGA